MSAISAPRRGTARTGCAARAAAPRCGRTGSAWRHRPCDRSSSRRSSAPPRPAAHAHPARLPRRGSPFGPLMPGLPAEAISCQPSPGQGPGWSRRAMKLEPPSATISRMPIDGRLVEGARARAGSRHRAPWRRCKASHRAAARGRCRSAPARCHPGRGQRRPRNGQHPRRMLSPRSAAPARQPRPRSPGTPLSPGSPRSPCSPCAPRSPCGPAATRCSSRPRLTLRAAFASAPRSPERPFTRPPRSPTLRTALSWRAVRARGPDQPGSPCGPRSPPCALAGTPLHRLATITFFALRTALSLWACAAPTAGSPCGQPPGSPCGPRSPAPPGSPRSPFSPCAPRSPCGPCAPAAPAEPNSP